jgi:uncharacterized protein YeeX (DUF496 family)
MLYQNVKSFEVVSNYVKYVKTSRKVNELEQYMFDMKADLGSDSPFYQVAKANFEQAKKDNADVLKLKEQFEALSAENKSLITMAMGEIPSKLGECEDFNKELNNTIERLKDGKCDATTVKRLCKVVNDNFMICKPYKNAGDTIIGAFLGMMFTGFKLGKKDPIKLKKRSDKQWTVQVMMYIYASCNH